MKDKCILPTIIILLIVGSSAYADRQLDGTETLQILQQLTSQPRKTWIPAGTIRVTHEEYKAPKTTDQVEISSQINQKLAEYQNMADKPELTENMQKLKLDAIPFNVRYELSNEYTMMSSVTVKYDGSRFYWEINVETRSDSVRPGTELADNFMTDEFNLEWNGRRIYAWDGERYTNYFLSSNRAIIDSTDNAQPIVKGPLTAGVVPWGYGPYSYDSLAACDSSAVEKYINGQTQIHLTLNRPNRTEIYVLDTAKNYAVISGSIDSYHNQVISNRYSDYQLVSGNWVPGTILLERYEEGTNRLLARDLWNIITIDGAIPTFESFVVEFQTDALKEVFTPVAEKSSIYYHSDTVDTDQLLAESLSFAAKEGLQKQNCATAALKYTLGQLGKEVSDSDLAELVDGSNNTTSLLAMKQFAEAQGLYCRAVTTDIDTLRNLNNCQVILHIPGKKHFVVLESIDNQFVRTIDLTERKFYYRTDVSFFGMDWSGGTALLISNSAIGGQLNDIGQSGLAGITGAAYDCNALRQNYNVIYCANPIESECEGWYRVFYERWGCGTAESGSCSQSSMIRYKKSPCVLDPYDLNACIITGNWTIYYMQACL